MIIWRPLKNSGNSEMLYMDNIPLTHKWFKHTALQFRAPALLFCFFLTSNSFCRWKYLTSFLFLLKKKNLYKNKNKIELHKLNLEAKKFCFGPFGPKWEFREVELSLPQVLHHGFGIIFMLSWEHNSIKWKLGAKERWSLEV